MAAKIAVVGGAGMLGEPVVRRLTADGFEVRLIARNTSAARERFPNLEVVSGDVEDPATLVEPLRGAEGVHVNLMGGPAAADHDRIEHLGTAAVARVAAEVGLSRLTYLSGAPAREENFRDAGSKAKFDAETAIRSSGVPYTIFQATWMMEALPLFVRGRSAIMIGKQAHPVRWIAADDYARMVAQAYAKPDTANKTYFVVGPAALTKPEALAEYVRLVRPDVKVRHAPIWAMRLLATLSFDPQLKADVRRLAFYDTIGDDFGDPSETDRTFGPATTTLSEWSAAQRDQARGA